ncbi:uncharacterized protein LOC127776576 [Oryza glaberrima]|uniref:Uncharacterized protein n=1 Tax=Oryza glaberrima TaxID=4538 RepID=A0A1V1H052_ORYGL|nr:uncharacterized protein LOC127776576 [Oryza glaberrima]XP_052158953.1 uncharacterized protein LOC127776576 [Oryza glaberrima]XP_052158954.1 uncharacterized protein LOC127776576 [Oryza glaberrima]XP_052158955.1 uncharacterized protein LOC127776576 [Oryza glaberrima]XP_052158956.1 uncharacterized protein LOC127776576 [Oryza glaberrima]BAX24749.1 hypothetical protein [Oryza glaberrima]
MDYDQADGLYDFPADDPVLTLNINRFLSDNPEDRCQYFIDQIESARNLIRAKCIKVVKGTGKHQTLYLTPEDLFVFTVAFTDEISTVTAIIEAKNMWVRGFRTSEGVIYEFKDEPPKLEELEEIIGHTNQKYQKFKGKIKRIAGKQKKSPHKFIKGSILLDHGSNYRALIGGGQSLYRLAMGFPILKAMINDLAHFDKNHQSPTAKWSMAVLIIHSPECLKNRYISSLMVDALENRYFHKLRRLKSRGKHYALNWDKYSGYILKSLDVPLFIWNANERCYRHNESFFLKEDAHINLETAMEDILFIKCDSYPESSFREVKERIINLPANLQSSIGIVLVNGVTYVLQRGTELPCIAELVLRTFTSSPSIQVIEGDLPVFSDSHIVGSHVRMNLEPSQGSKNIKVMVCANALRLYAEVYQIGNESTTKQREGQHAFRLDDELFRKHSEMCTKYSDTFQKLKELKVEMAEKLYSNLSDIDLICGTTQNPLTLKNFGM